MRQHALRLCLVGLMILLVGTACVRVDSEVRLNSTGQIEEMRGRVVLEDASVFSLANVPEEELEEYILLWLLTSGLGVQADHEVLGIEGFIDLQQIRTAGLDIDQEGLWDEVTMIRDHGKDPETGHVYIEYEFAFPEIPDEAGDDFDLAEQLVMLNDPMLQSLFGGEWASPLTYRVVTRMPGKVVSSDFGHTQVGQPDVHVAEIDLFDLAERSQRFRIVADPEQRVLPYDIVAIWPHPAMQEVGNMPGRYDLANGVAVQDVTFRNGSRYPEIAGQITNTSDRSYPWVSVGLSLFDVEGRFVDYHSLMIQNVAAGSERGFHKRLLHGDLSHVAYYRLEWALGF